MADKKKGSSRKSWRIDARTDNAFRFATRDVLMNAYNIEYPIEFRMNFIHIAFMNLCEATARIQSIPEQYIKLKNPLLKYFLEGIKRIYKVMNEYGLIDQLFSEVTKITIDDVIKCNRIILDNPYDEEKVDYNILNYPSADETPDDIVEIHQFPKIYIKFHDLKDIDGEIATNGDIILHLPYQFVWVINYKMVKPEASSNITVEPFLEIIKKILSKSSFSEYNLKEHEEILTIPNYNTFNQLTGFLLQMKEYHRTNQIKIIEAGMTGYRLGSYKKNKLYTLFTQLSNLQIPCKVYLETTARGEAKNNVDWALNLKKDGNPEFLNIKYSYHNIKVHAKMIYLKFILNDVEYCMSVFSTGNFNPSTADVYKDYICVSFNDTAKDLIEHNFNMLYNAKYPIASSISSIITNEICAEIAKGKNGRIRIQTNHLDNDRIVKLLKEAQRRGVDVKVICRTTQGYHKSDKLNSKCITGIYLEHARVYIFGKDSDKMRCYISSSDLMYRNLYNRFESYLPILDFNNIIFLLNEFETLWDNGQNIPDFEEN